MSKPAAGLARPASARPPRRRPSPCTCSAAAGGVHGVRRRPSRRSARSPRSPPRPRRRRRAPAGRPRHRQVDGQVVRLTEISSPPASRNRVSSAPVIESTRALTTSRAAVAHQAAGSVSPQAQRLCLLSFRLVAEARGAERGEPGRESLGRLIGGPPQRRTSGTAQGSSAPPSAHGSPSAEPAGASRPSAAIRLQARHRPRTCGGRGCRSDEEPLAPVSIRSASPSSSRTPRRRSCPSRAARRACGARRPASAAVSRM